MERGEQILTTQYWKLVHSSKNNHGRGYLASLPMTAAGWPWVLSHLFVKVSIAALSSILDVRWLYIRKAPLTPIVLPAPLMLHVPLHLNTSKQYRCHQWQVMLFGLKATGMDASLAAGAEPARSIRAPDVHSAAGLHIIHLIHKTGAPS